MKVKCTKGPGCINKCNEMPVEYRHNVIHEYNEKCNVTMCNEHTVKCVPVNDEMIITEDGNFSIKEDI